MLGTDKTLGSYSNMQIERYPVMMFCLTPLIYIRKSSLPNASKRWNGSIKSAEIIPVKTQRPQTLLWQPIRSLLSGKGCQKGAALSQIARLRVVTVMALMVAKQRLHYIHSWPLPSLAKPPHTQVGNNEAFKNLPNSSQPRNSRC